MGLYRRGQTWWISFVYKRKQYRKSTETEDKKLAQDIYSKVKWEVVSGKWFERLPGEDMSFTELKDRYLRDHSPKKSPKQYIGDKGIFENHLDPYLKDYLLPDITSDVISTYKAKRREEDAEPGTINRELTLLKHCFSMACGEWRLLRENPIKCVSLEKEPRGRVRYLSSQEFRNLHNSCADWLKPIVMVAYHTGMRRENILSLKWDQVDLFRRVITLEQTKNGERLSLPINDTLMNVFKKLLKVRHIRSSYVFCHRDGERFKEIKKAFRQATAKAKIENFKFHDLRHCFASSLIQEGADLYEVQRLLGHKDSRMTQRYAHLAPENLRNAVLRLDKVELEETASTNLAQSGSLDQERAR